MTQDPKALREQAAQIRAYAQYADGPQYSRDLAQARELEDQAHRLERQESAERTKDLKLIHIAKRDLALADEDYRAVLCRVTGKDSAADLDAGQRGRVLAEFKRLGWKPARAYRKRPAGQAATQADKIRALWIELDQAGALRDGTERGLGRYCRRMTSKQRPEWLQPGDANRVIESLKAWLARAKKIDSLEGA